MSVEVKTDKQLISDLYLKVHKLEAEQRDLKMIIESISIHLDSLMRQQELAVDTFIQEVKPQIHNIRTILNRIK